ncbi:MAG: tRNA (adenosine(37)-N6)-threonylcarbamoyltransferase complex transferase subunit TsaD [Myxococcota bacterium]
MLILGIETSCDETAAAVVRDGREILSSVVFSQVELHSRFGGVIPEIASRNHIQKIIPVIDEALARAGVAASQLDALAVTYSPGLIGALLVGVSVAKGISAALGKPLVAVNHLNGHLAAINLTGDAPKPPFIALLASGGHTQLYLCEDGDREKLIGSTLDDAAGEAFDKIAKLLGLGYPGGAALEMSARGGDKSRYRFPIVMPERDNFNMSFSGLKTAAATIIKREGLPAVRERLSDFCASFQSAIIENLCRKTFFAAERFGASEILVTGGVAANGALREAFTVGGRERGMRVYFPPLYLCGDNAAMIASAAFGKAKRGEFAPPWFSAVARFSYREEGKR